MIKKLSLKFVLVFLVLVVSVIITSSCYASETYTYVHDNTYEITVDNNSITFTNTTSGASKTIDCSYGFNNYSDYYIMSDFGDQWSSGWCFNILFSNNFKWSTSETLPEDYYGYVNIADLCLYRVRYMAGNFSMSSDYPVINPTNTAFVDYGLVIDSNDNITYPNTGYNHTLIGANHNIYGNSNPNLLLYQTTLDTSFNYSLNGIKRGQVQLEISNLDSSLRMYGYVGCKNNFNVGDTLDISSISSYLRLLAMYSDNSDLNCYLYDGEELLYYIVDENNVILDIGYISEMAKGNFLYGFNVYNGVDFVYLKDGQVYWDNSLIFKYSTIGNEIEDNSIVSAGISSYIKSDKIESVTSYTGYVYDSSNKLLSQASTTILNDLSSLGISVDTSYKEDKDFLNEGVWTINYISLEGTNFDGSLIDFSDYYVRWSIPTSLIIKEIRFNNSIYDKRNGIFDNPTAFGRFTCHLSIRDYISKYKDDKYVPFDITLEVYDSDDNLVLTHVINSDDIVKKQIASEENNVDKGDYDILDSPNYTGGSSGSPDINNIQNWTSDDYLNLMSTDNFVWEFFKAILGNLPWWITVPLTILIFGVVIITLIRFARGA